MLQSEFSQYVARVLRSVMSVIPSLLISPGCSITGVWPPIRHISSIWKPPIAPSVPSSSNS